MEGSSSGGGLTLPGYNYLGPGNELNSGVPINSLDQIAKQHDERYNTASKKFKRTGNRREFEEEIRRADREFLHEVWLIAPESTYDKFAKYLAQGGIGTKYLIESVTGVIYPNSNLDCCCIMDAVPANMWREGWKDFVNSFSGDINSIPYIGVDNFYDKTRKAYFLSHFHTDHTGGLIGKNGEHSNDLYENNVNIYMSKTTAAIFRYSTYLNDYYNLNGRIIPLRTDTVHELDIDGVKLQVTLIPVDHMPGAVMFLFKVASNDSSKEIRTILYTGDFVITNENLQEAYPSLHDNGKPIHIDELYCDNTHWHKFESLKGERLTDLPNRSTVIRDVTEKIQEWLEKDKKNIVAIRTFYDYAYEELFEEISRVTGQRITLSDQTRLAVCRYIFHNDEKKVYTEKYGRIHAYHNSRPSEYLQLQNKHNVMRIDVQLYNRPEALVCESDGPNPKYTLNYPTHCSRRQLDEFVEHFSLSPENIRYFPGYII